MKILVYEHVSGGGYAGQPLDPSVLSEGFAMLSCLAKDFKAAGHEVTVLLDARLSKFNASLDTDCIVRVFYAKENEELFEGAAKINDAVYVIAPETEQILQSFVDLEGKTGKLSLNCEAGAIHKITDKAVLYNSLKKNGLLTPQTLIFNVDDEHTNIHSEIKNKLGYPVVFKPVESTGCGGLSVVQEDSQIEAAVAKIKIVSSRKKFLVQEFIRGEPASVCLICAKDEALAISLNKQNVQLAPPDAASSYEGGVVPFYHPLRPETFATAEKVAMSLPGLRGYIGIDFVLTEGKPFVVDVNPRLTTSFVGLRGVAGFNVAEAIVNAVLKDKLPAPPENRDFSYFSKVKTANPSLQAFQKTTRTKGVISPPFPLDATSEAVSMVIGQGESMSEAHLRFEEAKKRLLNIIRRGK